MQMKRVGCAIAELRVAIANGASRLRRYHALEIQTQRSVVTLRDSNTREVP